MQHYGPFVGWIGQPSSVSALGFYGSIPFGQIAACYVATKVTGVIFLKRLSVGRDGTVPFPLGFRHDKACEICVYQPILFTMLLVHMVLIYLLHKPSIQLSIQWHVPYCMPN